MEILRRDGKKRSLFNIAMKIIFIKNLMIGIEST
jgi:hypothetical protein